MTIRIYPTVCGLWCDDCTHFEKDCSGCTNAGGSVFWTEYVDIDACPVCTCVQEKHLPHCGFCKEMPCERYTRFRDPDMNDEELKARLLQQRDELIRRRKESEQHK